MKTIKQNPSLIEIYSLALIEHYNQIKNLTLLIAAMFTFNIAAQTPQWEFMGLAGEIIDDIAIDDSGNIYVASSGVYKSTDDGVTWVFKNTGLEIAEALKLFIDNNGNIFLGAIGFPNTGCGLYKSTNGGEYWEKIADTLNGKPINIFYDIKIIPNEPSGIIYVSNYYGVYKSTDNGITWHSTNFNNNLAIDIGISTNGYMFFGNNTASWFGIYRSTNLGSNWERNAFLGVTAMAYLSDGSVLAGCYDPGLGTFGIYKTTDNGDTWFNTNTLSFGISDFVLDNNNDVYISSGYGVYLSTNNGNSWINYGLSGIEYILACMAIDSSGYVWAGADMNGVYRTAGRNIPVELVTFKVEVNNNNVLLSWITTSEINNQGFEIERAVISGWERIGFVEGSGTTTESKTYSYVDENVISGTYLYRLKQIGFNGTYEYSKIISVNVNVPAKFSLEQNYPNPFNPSTQIKYSIKQEELVQLKVYNILGKEIAKLVNENKEAGNYSVEFDASQLPSGVYIYQLTTPGFTQARKMILTK
jgi:photosystem II stability/assembly factor-like uncharacterized protein